ncbi:carbonic anhydrase [Ranunculus cassubicifolius]
MINNGLNIGMSYENSGGVANIDGKMYTIKQMHWHTSCEHTIDGQMICSRASPGTHVQRRYTSGGSDPLRVWQSRSISPSVER